jgi:hypothetical protein
MKRMNDLLISMLVIFTTLGLSAQTAKHNRVVEVEKYLSSEAISLLKARFPEHPFMATVSIDAVHRGTAANKTAGEKLPYLETDSEEIVDEWDDPAVSNIALLSRVKKVAVVLSLPDKITDDEISEIKTALYSNLNLIEARDSVEIRKRNFGGSSSSLKDNFGSYIAFGAIMWSLLIAGLFGLFWFLSARIKSGMKEIKIQTGTNGSANTAPAALPQMDSSNDRTSKSMSQISGDVKFSDPFKIKEILSSYVTKIEKMPHFPNFQQMTAMDEFCEKNTGECGALMYELPQKYMETLFSYSSENYWLQALNEPTDMNSSCIEILNKMIRLQDSAHPEVDTILIQMWRLGKDLPVFAKSLNQNEAFTLLSQLPASIGLAVAREAYPGSWGGLLNKTFSVQQFSADRLQFLDAQLKKMKPLRDQKYIQKFKDDQDLVKFLLITDPQTEKEIYQARENPKELMNLRQPFYALLDASDDVKKEFTSKINIEDWAYSFFNLSRSERKSFEVCFSDKQKFRYFEILKQLDQKNPPVEIVGRVREKIALQFYKYNTELAQISEQQNNIVDDEQKQAA